MSVEILDNDSSILARASLEYIRKDMNDISTSFIYLGFHLREMQDSKYYTCIPLSSGDGYYSNFYNLIQDYFGLSRSTVSRLVAINRRFCNGTTFLSDTWKGYSYSQLSEILTVEDKQGVCCFRPDMTVREIRDEKRKIHNPSNQQESLCVPCTTPSVLCDVAQGQEKFSLDAHWYYFRFLRCI